MHQTNLYQHPSCIPEHSTSYIAIESVILPKKYWENTPLRVEKTNLLYNLNHKAKFPLRKKEILWMLVFQRFSSIGCSCGSYTGQTNSMASYYVPGIIATFTMYLVDFSKP
jgi:hypothetical protein